MVVSVLSSQMPVPLLYRWSIVERAAAHLYRGIKLHGLFFRAFKGLFPPALVAKAEEAARAALAANEEVPQQFKAQVRGGACIKSLEQDPKGVALETALILNSPLQAFLNHAVKSEK